MTILELFSRQRGPIRIRKLVRLLGLPMDARKRVRRLLKELVREGQVVAEGHGRYNAAIVEQQVEGIFIKKGRGFGLKQSETDRSIMLSVHQDDRAGALPGDRVRAVRFRGRERGLANGRVVEILEHGQRPILGVYRKGKQGGVVVPDDSRLEHSYKLDQNEASKLSDGVLVAISVPGLVENGQRFAKLVKVIGNPGQLQTELERIVLEYGLCEGFPTEVEQNVLQGAGSKANTARRDLRGLPHITIDPHDAKDFDDAIAIEKHSSGYRLWVSIADVSSYVNIDSAVDNEAFQRGLSVYFPSGVFPMLPHKLSENLCSLVQGQDRHAFTVELEIGSSGQVEDGKIYRSTIRSVARLTYQEVQQTLDGQPISKTRSIHKNLHAMGDCAQLLIKRMETRGALDLDLPEHEIRLDEHQQPVEVGPKKRLFAHRIIETFMVTANEAIARLLKALEAPGIYRVHPPPDAEKMATFMQMIQALGVDTGSKNTESTPRKLVSYLKNVSDDRTKQMIHQLLLRSLMQARYDSEPQQHYGLASRAYLHFTSPIRRYPDLVVHRQCKALLDSGNREVVSIDAKPGRVKWFYSHEQTAKIAEWCTHAERLAQEAERAAVRLFQVAYMQKHLGEVCEAAVSFVMDFGVFVQVLPYGVEGLVHVSRMADDYYRYFPEKLMLIGRRSGKIYRIGDRVKVKVDSIQLSRGEIDLSFVDD